MLVLLVMLQARSGQFFFMTQKHNRKMSALCCNSTRMALQCPSHRGPPLVNQVLSILPGPTTPQLLLF